MNEPTIAITDEYANTVCKTGQGKACCRYLSIGPNGWSCLKNSDLKGYIDDRVSAGTMKSIGDNCEGRMGP